MYDMFANAPSFNSDLTAWQISPTANTDNMFRIACSMEEKNLPATPTLQSTGLIACTFCTNCPPEGGECLHGFKREDSVNCNVCPDGATNINNSCVSCPKNPFLSFFLSFLALLVLVLLIPLLYFLRNTRFVQSIEPQTNLTNLIRTKQIGAALSILVVFAALSPNLSDWFTYLANIFSTISMPFEIKPVCQEWYETVVRGDNYFSKAWMAFIFIYAVSVLLRYAQKLKRNNGELWFEIKTLVNFQKLAALLIIQAPIIVLSMTLDPERMAGNVDGFNGDNTETVTSLAHSVLPSLFSFFLLALLLFLTIRLSSKEFKKIRDKLLLETDIITSEETIKDIEMQGPYFAAFCLQYTPQMYNREETQVLKNIFWVFATKAVQFVAVVLSDNDYLLNLACVRTAASSTVLVATNLWYMRLLLKRPYASHRPSSKFGDPMNEAELLTTRTISLAAALLSLRDTLAMSTVTGETFVHG
ncbi:hypothetical protein TL16_g09335 [Triparma laevis f. inornata]|uniref:Uncharacterized protein n=1 Tax=Triparma laevis f. inornata TaxID=1714386 RepID=A0A9W7EMK9_9STRA|nr:hypothetical protein TL16_g09335 [Triparma laevis f. inornata]